MAVLAVLAVRGLLALMRLSQVAAYRALATVYIEEEGPPGQVIEAPSHERTRTFLARLLDPAAAEATREDDVG